MMLLDWFGPVPIGSEIARIPDGIPGVYLLHGFDPGFGGYPVLYAGKAGDLRRRLTEHLVNPRVRLQLKTSRERTHLYFSAAPVMNQLVRDGVESGLIRALQPMCNRQVPLAAPILVNLPPLHVLSLGGASA